MQTQMLVDGQELEAMVPEKEKAGQRHWVRFAAMGLGVAGLAAGLVYYLHARGFESTDNAFIEGTVVQVSPRIAGQVVRVHVADNQHVNRGDLIAELDAKDFEVRVAEVQARIADIGARTVGARSGLELTSNVTSAVLEQAGAAAGAAREQIAILKERMTLDAAKVKEAEAGLAQAQAHHAVAAAEAKRAEDDAARYMALFAKDEVSRQALERVQTQARAASAVLDASQHVIEGTRAALTQSRAAQAATVAALRQAERQVEQAQGRVSEAQAGPRQVEIRKAELSSLRAQHAQLDAALEQAQLALGYTRIYAPESGFVTRKGVEVGMFVQPGQPLLAIVSDKLWVVANFKETQITEMRPGQEAMLRIDAYPNLRLKGHVESIQSGTGARFSLLPAENATGNYVKVVQRVPVKIVFDEAPPAGYRIGPGMSVEPEVKVQ